MKLTEPTPEGRTAQELYDCASECLDSVLNDVHEIEVLAQLVADLKKFLEDNHSVT